MTAAGYRCIVPDLIGFGRSDKPADKAVHTYKFHVDAIAALVAALDLKGCTFFGQDWGGLIGLRVVTENEAAFRADRHLEHRLADRRTSRSRQRFWSGSG